MGRFSYGGVDLESVGAKIALMDGVASLPPVRGRNLLMPYQPGQRHVTKYYDERVVVLQGVLAATTDLGELETKIDQLKVLFPIEAGEQQLLMQREDGTQRYLLAEVRNLIMPLDAKMGRRGLKFSIELVASDPLWYDLALEAGQVRLAWFLDSGVLLDDGNHWLDSTNQYFVSTLTTSPAVVEASNGGNAATRRAIFRFRGVTSNLTILNLRNGYSLRVARTTTGLQEMVIDCGARTVTIDGAGQQNPVVLGAAQADWMRLEPGDNSLRITVGVTPVAVTYQARYSPAYL